MIAEVGIDLGLKEEWLNFGPAPLMEFALPEGLKTRLTRISYSVKQKQIMFTPMHYLSALLVLGSFSTHAATASFSQIYPNSPQLFGSAISVGPHLSLTVERDGNFSQAATVEIEFLASPLGESVFDDTGLNLIQA